MTSELREIRTEIADELLTRGLVLFLGSGISRDLGLPVWWELVRSCCSAAKISVDGIDENSSSAFLLEKMSEVRRVNPGKRDLHSLIKTELYRNVEFKLGLGTQSTLVAVGALIIAGTRLRLSKVFTRNFDDVLEWFLYQNGLSVQVITSLPYILWNRDVRIFHPHGFVPGFFDDATSPRVEISSLDYDKLFSRGRWLEETKRALIERAGLFVGLSGNDPDFGPILVGTHEALKEVRTANRPVGYWLLGPDAPEEKVKWLEERGVKAAKFRDFSDLADFLWGICEETGRREKVEIT